MEPSHPPLRQWKVGSLSYGTAGLVMLFIWLLFGDFSFMMRERSAAPVVQLMLKSLKATDLITGLFMLTIPWVAILLAGPAVSYWSDRCRSRWGRRIPFLLLPTPVVTGAMFGLAFSPQLAASLSSSHWFGSLDQRQLTIGLIGFFWTFFEIGVVISNAVFNGLINDVVPREFMGRFYGLFRAVGLGAGILFNYKIIGLAETHATTILASIGALYGIGFTVMCLRVKEGEYPPPAPVEAANPVLLALKDYWHGCFSRPYYLLVFLFLGLANLAFVPVNLFGIFAAQTYGMTMETYGRYLVVTYLCSFSLAYPLGWCADRWHSLRIGLAALAIYTLAMGVGFLMITDARSFGWFFLAHGVLSGAFFTAIASLPQMLFPRIRFAQFAAAAGLVAALFNISLGPLLGGWMDWLGNQYRYVFLVGSCIGLVGFLLGLWLHARWQSFGGRQNYQAPE
jgi:MFS family permease